MTMSKAGPHARGHPPLHVAAINVNIDRYRCRPGASCCLSEGEGPWPLRYHAVHEPDEPQACMALSRARPKGHSVCMVAVGGPAPVLSGAAGHSLAHILHALLGFTLPECLCRMLVTICRQRLPELRLATSLRLPTQGLSAVQDTWFCKVWDTCSSVHVSHLLAHK